MARGPLAGAAGPGKYSVRTDGLTLPSQAYGEGVETAAIKSGAPLAKTQDAVRVTGATRPTSRAEQVRLYDETQRPQEPITSGIPLGEGPGPEALGMRPQMQAQEEDDLRFRAAIKDYMPVLAYVSSLPNTSPETRRVIRQLRDNL